MASGIGIIIMGHGHFATGIASAVKLIAGGLEDCATVDFPEGDTKTELEAHIGEALEQMKDKEHILVFCDILSGSPFKTIFPRAMEDPRIRVYYGTHLGILFETVMNRDIGDSWEQLLEGITERGREQTGLSVPEAAGTEDEDDDWS